MGNILGHTFHSKLGQDFPKNSAAGHLYSYIGEFVPYDRISWAHVFPGHILPDYVYIYIYMYIYIYIYIRSGYSSGSRTQLYSAIRPALPVCARESSG